MLGSRCPYIASEMPTPKSITKKEAIEGFEGVIHTEDNSAWIKGTLGVLRKLRFLTARRAIVS